MKIASSCKISLRPYLKKVPRGGAQHLQDLVVSRVLTELEEHLSEQLQYCVGRYIYKPQKKLLRVLASLIESRILKSTVVKGIIFYSVTQAFRYVYSKYGDFKHHNLFSFKRKNPFWGPLSPKCGLQTFCHCICCFGCVNLNLLQTIGPTSFKFTELPIF